MTVLTKHRQTASEIVFTNARLVLPDRVVEGTLLVRDGYIADIEEAGVMTAAATDLEGDYLLPGLVELHTDNLERHMRPRPSADWPAIPAVLAHDGEIASCGITTVFDALAIGDVSSDGVRVERMHEMIEAIETASRKRLIRADHRLHLRCEISYPDLADALAPLAGHPLVQLVSVMDHTPGQRQFRTLKKYVEYYKGKYAMDDATMERFIEQRVAEQQTYAHANRRHVVSFAHEHGYALASHDDATEAHVAEAVADGMTIAEFPTTVEAARASHENGLGVMMGGPNLVRGGSHSGNVAARELAELGVLDIVSSDYAPSSLLHGAFILAGQDAGSALARAIAMVTRNPARAAGLDDRGEVAVGRRADLVRVRRTAEHPVIGGVWRAGARIA